MKLSILRQIKRDRIFLLLLAPTLIFFVMFRYVPMFGISIAFMDFNLFKGIAGSEWAGLKYFKLFLESPDAWVIIKNTLFLGLYKLLFVFPAPILLALMLNEVQNMLFKRFVQTLSYLPYFLSLVVVASMIDMFLSPSTGWLNHAIQSLGFPAINFLQEPEWFRTIFISSEIWQQVGWGSIIYLAAMTGIDPQLYEAARMDGAGRLKQIWHVTIPGIAPTVAIMFLLQVGSILEISVEKVFLLSNAATYDTSDIVSTYVYRIGLVQGSFSYAAAIDLFMGVIGFALVYLSNRISRKFSETSLW